MYIKETDISLSSTAEKKETSEKREHLRFEVPSLSDQQEAFTMNISEKAIKNYSAENSISQPLSDMNSENTPTMKLQIMKMVLEKFFGAKIEIADFSDKNEGETEISSTENPDISEEGVREERRFGWSFEYSVHEIKTEKEDVSFNAEGTVITEDKREIDINLSFGMSRETYEEYSLKIEAGDKIRDPLILSFNNTPPEFKDRMIKFDIDSDSTEELIPELKEGSGFLFIDKNNNNRVDNGSELFGPHTGRGFEELRELDSDNNNWIDEADPLYSSLKVWSFSESGEEQIKSLKDMNVGALFLNSVKTPITVNNGIMKNSSVYLNDNGSPGLISEFDLLVRDRP